MLLLQAAPEAEGAPLLDGEVLAAAAKREIELCRETLVDQMLVFLPLKNRGAMLRRAYAAATADSEQSAPRLSSLPEQEEPE